MVEIYYFNLKYMKQFFIFLFLTDFFLKKKINRFNLTCKKSLIFFLSKCIYIQNSAPSIQLEILIFQKVNKEKRKEMSLAYQMRNKFGILEEKKA